MRLGRCQGAAGNPLARRCVRSAPAGGRSAADVRERVALSRPAAGRLPAGRRAARPNAMTQPQTRARHGRRRRRRHSAFRAHHGRRRRIVRCCASSRPSAACASTCIATRPTIRCRATSRRSLPDPAAGLQGRVAGSHLTSMHSMDNYYVSKLLPLIAEPAWRHRQPADQHHAAGPPRHLSQAARHDARARNDGAGINVASATIA
jgi:hypothetical protein